MSKTRQSIAYVVNSLNPGGAEKLAVDMALEFASEYDIKIFCLDEPGVWAKKIRSKKIPIYSLWRQAGIDIGASKKLGNYFKKHQVKIIHAHQYSAWFYSALSKIIYSDPKLLFEEHGRFYPEVVNRKRILLNKLLLQRITNRTVAVSFDIKERLIRYEGISSSKIDVIYNGVKDTSRISKSVKDRLRNELGIMDNEFLVGTACRFDPIKNLPLLVKSISLAHLKYDNIRGLLIGDGPSFEEIKSYIHESGMKDIILMTGFRKDAQKFIQCLDLFALSSLSEGTSLALLEAMSAGIPVVVTDVGGNPEIVIKNKTGWVVSSGSVKQLSSAILDAIENKNKREGYGIEGARRYQKEFTFDLMVSKYHKIYKTLL